MKNKINFNTKKDVYEWKRDKLLLTPPSKEIYYWYDYKNDKFYKHIDEITVIEISEYEVGFCYARPTQDTICFLGKGEISSFAHYSPRSNGYPEMPWDQMKLSHVYIFNPLFTIDDFYKCTFNHYDTISHSYCSPTFITDENIKLRDIIDPNYIYSKLSYEEILFDVKSRLNL